MKKIEIALVILIILMAIDFGMFVGISISDHIVNSKFNGNQLDFLSDTAAVVVLIKLLGISVTFLIINLILLGIFAIISLVGFNLWKRYRNMGSEQK